jgi:thioesterase domain-containing protein
MLPLRPLGSKTKIFWVHYLNANLARKIGDDQPFFSVTLTAEDVRALGASPTLERIGACMVNKIRAVQPEGPYILGGLCLGGVLAYEMASQLRAAGEEIRLLVVIDPPNPSNTRDHGSLARRWSYWRYLIKRAEWLGPRTTLLYSMEKLINTLPWQWWNHLSVGKVHMAQELVETAVYFYRPRACKGPVLLLLASEQLPHTNTLARWQAIVPRDLYTEYVDAYHRELMEPDNASRIAEAIISRLAALEAAPSTQLESSSAAATEIRNGGAVDLGLALQE